MSLKRNKTLSWPVFLTRFAYKLHVRGIKKYLLSKLGAIASKRKVFPLSKLHEIKTFKSYIEATTAGLFDQLWTKGICSSHPRPLLGKVKTTGQGLASMLTQEAHLSGT